jgi:predicted Zn finger-like uncharacterized protein
MYTRCPSCSATFRLTAALLQMADGEVRCGSCGAVFNALHTLVDDWSGPDLMLPGAPRLTHPDAPVRPVAAEDAAEAASTETLEFNVPENEWQRFFIAAEEEALADPEAGAYAESEISERAPANAADGDSAEDTQDQPALKLSLEDETADTDTWQAFLRETEADDEPPYVIGEDGQGDDHAKILLRPFSGGDDGGGQVAAAMDADEEDVVEVAFAVEAPVEAPFGGPAVDHGAPAPPETVLDWGPPPAFPERVPRPPAHTFRWLTACLLAAALLGGQVIHHFRDALAADPDYGPAILGVYGRLGQPLYPAWPLDAYEIRDAKAIAERSAPGALDIVAEIAVTGRQAVGLPLVRVVLRDRWSNPIASGVFDPARYLAQAETQGQAHAPGSLIPVEISIKDPGAAAQGYELDVCLPDRKRGLQCKTANDPFRS